MKMTGRIGAAITMTLAAATAWAQSPAPSVPQAANPAATLDGSRSNRMAMPGSARSGKAGAVQAQATPRQRMQEMENTLTSMHALLKQMQAKAAKNNSKDSNARANLQMWELMLTHLDKQFGELRVATLEREDMEARRAAMYKQAFDKADKAAAEARAAQAPVAAGQAPPEPSAPVPPLQKP